LDIISNDTIKMGKKHSIEMKKNILLAITAFCSILAFASIASANVGIIVEFPNGTVYTQCVSVSDGKDTYDVLGKTELDAEWTGNGQWGRGLCMIDGVGSEPAGDACSDWNSYWAFSLALDKDGSWTTHSPVGFTMGECWNRDYETPSFDGHYCTKDGDVIGLHYTNEFPSGYPKFTSFDEICQETDSDNGPQKKAMLMSSRPYWRAYAEGCGINFTDMVSPQELRKRCDEHQAELFALGNGSIAAEMFSEGIGEAGLIQAINFDYSPKVLNSLPALFIINFSSENEPLVNREVTVNGRILITDSSGSISFTVENGDYLVELAPTGFAPFSKIFRIGG